MTNQTKPTVRSLALDSLLAIERDGKYSNLEISARLDRNDLSAADRALYTRLVYGVTERRITLDYVIGQYASRPTETLDPLVRDSLRLGLYQLLFMDKIPAHAAVDESVRLVPRAASGFVNAVLRTFLRNEKAIRWPDKSDFFAYLSVKESVPVPLAEHFLRICGNAETERLLAAMNEEPAVCLRVNTLRMTAEEAAERLGGTVSAWARDIVRVEAFSETVRMGLENGDWFVQDEASRAATMALGAEPGETVADTCACPGGKTFSAALDMQGEGVIHACDLHRNKLSLIEKARNGSVSASSIQRNVTPVSRTRLGSVNATVSSATHRAPGSASLPKSRRSGIKISKNSDGCRLSSGIFSTARPHT